MIQRERNKYINEIKSSIVCPYSKDITIYSVACESLVKGASSYLKFKEKSEAKAFAEKYCCNIEKYTKCPIYCMNTKFYEILAKKKHMEERRSKIEILK